MTKEKEVDYEEEHQGRGVYEENHAVDELLNNLKD